MANCNEYKPLKDLIPGKSKERLTDAYSSSLTSPGNRTCLVKVEDQVQFADVAEVSVQNFDEEVDQFQNA